MRKRKLLQVLSQDSNKIQGRLLPIKKLKRKDTGGSQITDPGVATPVQTTQTDGSVPQGTASTQQQERPAGTYVESMCGPDYVETKDENGNPVCVSPEEWQRRLQPFNDASQAKLEEARKNDPNPSGNPKASWNPAIDGPYRKISGYNEPLESNFSSYCPECSGNDRRSMRQYRRWLRNNENQNNQVYNTNTEQSNNDRFNIFDFDFDNGGRGRRKLRRFTNRFGNFFDKAGDKIGGFFQNICKPGDLGCPKFEDGGSLPEAQIGLRNNYFQGSSEKPSWQDYMAVYNSAQNYKKWLEENKLFAHGSKTEYPVNGLEGDLGYSFRDKSHPRYNTTDMPVDPETGTSLRFPKGFPMETIGQEHNHIDAILASKPENWLWIAERRRQELERGYNPWTNKPIPNAPAMEQYFKPLNRYQFMQGDISPFVFETATLTDNGELKNYEGVENDFPQRPDDPTYGLFPRVDFRYGAPMQLFDTRIKPSRLMGRNMDPRNTEDDFGEAAAKSDLLGKMSNLEKYSRIDYDNKKKTEYGAPGGFPECPGCMQGNFYYEYDLPEDIPYITSNKAFDTNYVGQDNSDQPSGSYGSGTFYKYYPKGKKTDKPVFITADQYNAYKKQGMLEGQPEKRTGGSTRRLKKYQGENSQIKSNIIDRLIDQNISMFKSSFLNPNNWGVEDYTDKYETWDEAYAAAKRAGLKEIMWNKGPNPGRKNLEYAGTPRQEVGAYGINGQKIHPMDINHPAQISLYPPSKKYLPGHVMATTSPSGLSVDWSSAGNDVLSSGSVDVKAGDKTYNVYGYDPGVFFNKVSNLPLGIFAARIGETDTRPVDFNLLTNNCADNVCDAFGIPRGKIIRTPNGAVRRIEKEYPTLETTGRTYEDYENYAKSVRDNMSSSDVLNHANYLLGLTYSPELQNSEVQRILVGTIQNALVEQGYKLPKSTKPSVWGSNFTNFDAIYGPETKAALEDWQKKNKKQKGGLIKAQDGKVLTYANSPEYFDNRAVYHDDPRYNDLIRKFVYAGTHGFNPDTGELVKLDSPVFVPQDVRRMANQTGPSGAQESFNRNMQNPEFRKKLVETSTTEAYQNPLMYAPGSIGMAMLPPAWGSAYGLGLAGTQLAQGNYGTAGLTAGLSALPFVPSVISSVPKIKPFISNEVMPRVLQSDIAKRLMSEEALRNRVVSNINLTNFQKYNPDRIGGGGYGQAYSLRKFPELVLKVSPSEKARGTFATTARYEDIPSYPNQIYPRYFKSAKDVLGHSHPEFEPTTALDYEVMSRIPGVSARKLTGQQMSEIPLEAYSELRDQVDFLRRNDIGIDFQGDNLMYDLGTKRFGLIDLSPEASKSAEWAKSNIFKELSNTTPELEAKRRIRDILLDRFRNQFGRLNREMRYDLANKEADLRMMANQKTATPPKDANVIYDLMMDQMRNSRSATIDPTLPQSRLLLVNSIMNDPLWRHPSLDDLYSQRVATMKNINTFKRNGGAQFKNGKLKVRLHKRQ